MDLGIVRSRAPGHPAELARRICTIRGPRRAEFLSLNILHDTYVRGTARNFANQQVHQVLLITSEHLRIDLLTPSAPSDPPGSDDHIRVDVRMWDPQCRIVVEGVCAFTPLSASSTTLDEQ